MGDNAPLAKQIKIEKEEPITARVILDSNKVEEATKTLGKIPKKLAKPVVSDAKEVPVLQVGKND